MLEFVLLAVAGKLIIFFWQKFPLPQRIENIWKIKELHECGLCSGFWIYAILSVLVQINIFTLIGISYIPILSEIVTGAVTSYVVHIFSLGFEEYHLNITVV